MEHLLRLLKPEWTSQKKERTLKTKRKTAGQPIQTTLTILLVCLIMRNHFSRRALFFLMILAYSHAEVSLPRLRGNRVAVISRTTLPGDQTCMKLQSEASHIPKNHLELKCKWRQKKGITDMHLLTLTNSYENPSVFESPQLNYHWPVGGVLSVWACWLRRGCVPWSLAVTLLLILCGGASRLSQLSQGSISILNTWAHSLRVQLAFSQQRELNVISICRQTCRNVDKSSRLKTCKHLHANRNTQLSHTSLTKKLGSLPESILLRMVRAHFKKPSSTFSPVRALVSKNISSEFEKSTNSKWRYKEVTHLILIIKL